MIKVMKVKSSLKDAEGNYLPLYPDAQMPKAAHPGTSLAWDLYSVHDGDINPGSILKVYTGIAMECAPMACGFIVKERSSQGSKGIFVLAGVIDADYRGEIKVILANFGNEDYSFKKGDRIAQIYCIPALTGQPIVWYDSLSTSDRGEGGFGSTGV